MFLSNIKIVELKNKSFKKTHLSKKSLLNNSHYTWMNKFIIFSRSFSLTAGVNNKVSHFLATSIICKTSATSTLQSKVSLSIILLLRFKSRAQ